MGRRYADVYFSPNRGALEVVLGFIDRCKVSIDAAIYSITHDDIAQALIRAHERGVRVRILTDSLQASGTFSDHQKLTDAGIEVRLDSFRGSMHNKFVIGDGLAVGTGSFNWTLSAEERNAENFVILRLGYMVRQFEAEFERLWALHP
jgi:cardiolipin hydrolase